PPSFVSATPVTAASIRRRAGVVVYKRGVSGPASGTDLAGGPDRPAGGLLDRPLCQSPSIELIRSPS
ncbi:MAG: hypothetical protein M3O15_04380, partial [Acidobacteriota bacterium]|nr:hypothetical protein [Acidobacteriota bacterium]